MTSQTRLIITPTNQDFTIPGDYSATQIKSMYGTDISGLARMESSETNDGTTRTITFRNPTGTKGASQTRLIITPTNQDFTIPGDYSAAQIKSMYGTDISGLSRMESSETNDGTTRTITFRNPTGTKG